jgi:predicted anti-sigma-YlaC factor YlaD
MEVRRMSQAHIARSDPPADHHEHASMETQRHVSHFWRHFLEMLGIMAAGMIVTGAVFVSVVGLKTWDEITYVYPTQALMAMAFGMTVPMVAWMLYRGMGWKNSYEMARVMVLPVIPFLCLVWFNITESAQCGAYCLFTVFAMLGLMRYRRNEYSMQM